MSRHDPLRGAPGHLAGAIGQGRGPGGMTLEQMQARTAEQRARAVPSLGVNFDPTHAQVLIEGKHPLDVGASTIIRVPIETYLLLAGQIIVGGIVPMLAGQRQVAERSGTGASPSTEGTEANAPEAGTVAEAAGGSADTRRKSRVWVVRLFSFLSGRGGAR